MRGIANEEKRRAIFDKHRFHADMLILQETHSDKSCESVWKNEWGGEAFFSHGTTAARGVAIFTSKSIASKISKVEIKEDGRLIIVDLKENGVNLTIVSLYAPNEDIPEFFTKIIEKLRNRQEHKIIIGDFNLALDVDMDRLNTYNNNNKALTEVENMMDEFYLKDIWRTYNGNMREYSWIKRGSIPTKASRIDYALVSAGIDQKVEMIQYISSIKTDHRGVYLMIDLEPFERGKGFWKMNTSLLQEHNYISQMNEDLERTIKAAALKKPIELWETIKKRIKTTTINYCRNRSSEERLIISQLSEKVNEYESNLPLNLADSNLLEATKEELEEKTFERIKGVMFRSKVKWYEEGERSSKYFYALEKAKYNAKTCFKLIKDDGSEVSTPGTAQLLC